MRLFSLLFLCVLLYGANSQILCSQAYEELNLLRQRAGMIALKKDPRLVKAAQAHAAYLVHNNFAPTHYESPKYPLFTGVWPWDRAVYAGYRSRVVSENLSALKPNAKKAIDDLMGALYHRILFLDFSIDSIGIGTAASGHYSYKSLVVFDMGDSKLEALCTKDWRITGSYNYDLCAQRTKKIPLHAVQEAKNQIAKSNPQILLWPPKNARAVPPVFYEEEPDPLPQYGVSGYPVSIQFNPYYFKPKDIVLMDLRLFRGDTAVPAIVMDSTSDPNHRLPAMTYALFAKKRLAWNTTYRVEAKFRIRGKMRSLSWHFSTASLPYPYYTICSERATVHLRPHRKYVLYFPPKDAFDTIHSIAARRPASVRLFTSFIDFNTLIVQADGAVGQEATVRLSDGKSVHLILSGYDEATTP